ncbi:hypothetical protein OE88DRAFT_1484953 [Heliocybe sulcata]|uniref:Uncharacterized protein n=1 Tax=Heliocybe sulcata TaxID=5364 RepID=A0A5C3N750_9AGAM|nr:hypothetical protein OE88DRAFT_1484953 [Heliocybe sulcata]
MPSTLETRQRSGSRHADRSPVKSYDPASLPPARGRFYDLSSPKQPSSTTSRTTASSSRDQRLLDVTSQSVPDSWLGDVASSYVVYDEPASSLSPPNIQGGRPSSRSRSPMPHGPTQHFKASLSHPRAGSTSDLKAMARPHTSPRSGSPMLTGTSPAMRHQTQPHMPSSSMHPSPTSRRTINYSGNMSDSSAHGVGSRLDMKRLLSKPAAPSHSGSSIISAASDSEPAPASPTRNRTPVSAYEKDGSPVSASPDHIRGRQSILKTSSYTAHLSPRKREASIPRPSSSRETSSSARHEEEIATALRRKTGGSPALRVFSSSSPTTPTPTISAAATSSSQPAMPSLTIDPTYGSRPTTSPGDRSIGRAAGRRYHGTSVVTSVAATKRRENNASEPVTPVGLTPAGAVALAYKQQERRREQFASVATEEDPRHSKSRSLDDAREPSQEGRGSGEHSAAPYYTVFGSTSGKVVAVGGPDDHDWAYAGTTVYVEQREDPRAARPARSLKRSLSRNMSATFKKGKGAVKEDGSPEPSDHTLSTEALRSTLQDRRGAGLPKERRKSLRLSIDDFAERRVVDPLLTGRSLPASRQQTVQAWGDFSAGSGGPRTPSRPTRLVKPKDTRKKEDDGSSGGKLWKLMKRISTGGLREKYASQDSSPPPVPALPKEYMAQSPVRSLEPVDSVDRGTGLARFIQSRPSMAVSRSPGPSSPSSIVGPRRGSNATSGNRPSTTTRSSSPVSSDRTSSKFFHRSHSARSSSSSYGEEIPPVPSGMVGQHIIPPSELYKLNDETESPKAVLANNQGLFRSMSHDESPSSLPCPPRRLGSAGKDSTSTRPSGSAAPTVPPLGDFEPLGAPTLSHFSPQSSDGDTSTWTSPITPASGVPLSEFGVQPPPRPPRSSKRAQGGSTSSNGSHSSPLSGTLGPSTLPTFTITPTDERENPMEFETDSEVTRDRDSCGASSNASTARGRPRSSSVGSRTNSPSASGLTFREFGVPSKHQLTEKEKADKWDDLLERSARAGGTLHIGGEGGLMSDNIRFSQYSEI